MIVFGRKPLFALLLTLTLCGLTVAQGANPAAVRKLGTLKSISGSSLTMSTDAGETLQATVAETARLLCIAPGETSLKNATPLQLGDLQAGDRIRVAGTISADGKTLVVASLIAIKSMDIAQKHQQDLADWQRHGIGGLVKSVDAANRAIVITVTSLVGAKEITVHAAPAIPVSRYAPSSILFDDAKPAPFETIKAGDQLRARGTKSSDGTHFEAAQIVSGTFHNIAGTITAIDLDASTMTVQDLSTKKPVTVKITSAAQIKKIPAQMAFFLAASLKGQTPGAAQGQGAAGASGQPAASGTKPAVAPQAPQAPQAPAWGNGTGGNNNGGAAAGGQHGAWGGNAAGGRPGGGAPDLQQMLGHLPLSTLKDFQKGEAVMIVTTEGDGVSATAISVLGGVEAILTASPKGGSILTPWNLSSSGGAGAGEEGGE